jgi:MFS family permease
MWFHITMFFSANETGPALALVATSTALSQVIGAPIGAALILMDGLRGIRGWRWLFMLEGIITVAFGILFYVSTGCFGCLVSVCIGQCLHSAIGMQFFRRRPGRSHYMMRTHITALSILKVRWCLTCTLEYLGA